MGPFRGHWITCEALGRRSLRRDPCAGGIASSGKTAKEAEPEPERETPALPSRRNGDRGLPRRERDLEPEREFPFPPRALADLMVGVVGGDVRGLSPSTTWSCTR